MFIPQSKFNIILEDGGVLNKCTLRCNKGVVRDQRDLNNALKWEGQIRATNDKNTNVLLKRHHIYSYEEVKVQLLNNIQEEDNMENKVIIVFIGPSGSGKTKLGWELRKKNIPELISHTERDPRIKDKEVHGVHYYFVSKEEMDNTELVEFAEYAGKRYGLSVKEVTEKLANNDVVYAITELNGVKQIKDKYGDSVVVIYVHNDPEIARQRMIKRGDTEENIAKRMKNAVVNKEYENAKYADEIVDNSGDFENSKKQLFEIVERLTGKKIQAVI